MAWWSGTATKVEEKERHTDKQGQNKVKYDNTETGRDRTGKIVYKSKTNREKKHGQAKNVPIFTPMFYFISACAHLYAHVPVLSLLSLSVPVLSLSVLNDQGHTCCIVLFLSAREYLKFHDLKSVSNVRECFQ